MNNYIKNNKKLYFILPILWMSIIFYFSSQCGSVSSNNNFYLIHVLKESNLDITSLIGGDLSNFLIRKAAHVTEYLILCILLIFALRKNNFKRPILTAFICCVLYAMTDEFHQLFVIGRDGKVKDVFIDSIGVVIGCIIMKH